MKFRQLFSLFAFVFMAFISTTGACAELSDGDLVPTSGANVGVKAGDIAPDLELYDLRGNLQQVSFKNTPTLIVSLYTLNGDVNKIKQLAHSYSKHKDLNLLFVVRDEAEYVNVFLVKHDLDIPVYFERKKEFARKYNAGVPSMVIVDKNGIVRYNNTFFVELNSVDSYLENLISGNGDQPPKLVYSAPKEVKQEVPKLVNIGETVPADVFRDLEGSPVKLEYKEKPTVIFYWMSFTNEKFLNEMIPVMQKVYEAKGDKANFYTINGSGDRRGTMNRLDRYYSSFPVLVGGQFLQYSRSFPFLMIIDKNGVLRYKPSKFPNAEVLEEVLSTILDEQ